MPDIRTQIAAEFLEIGSTVSWEAERVIIALLSAEPGPEDWRHYETVTGHEVGLHWFFWRDPTMPSDAHVDEALFENGKIVAKAGCGLDYFTECQPCRLPEDITKILANR